jgi:hypothetical protein
MVVIFVAVVVLVVLVVLVGFPALEFHRHVKEGPSGTCRGAKWGQQDTYGALVVRILGHKVVLMM